MAVFLLGILGGGRTFLIAAIVAWTARLGELPLSHAVSWLPSTPVIALLSLAALGELLYDKSPRAQSRKRAEAWFARVLLSAIVGFAIVPTNALLGAALGGAGALLGTYLLHAFRARMASAFARDLPAALIEDFVIIAGALFLL